MDSVDTNLLVRFYTDDEPRQADIAEAILSSGNPVFVPASVILELVWVLQRTRYRLPRSRVVAILRHLLAVQNIEVERAAAVTVAVNAYERGLDFADALHLAKSAHCERLLTFDRRLVNRAKKLRLMPRCEQPRASP